MSELEAYAHCLRLARSHYENFPVASILLPRTVRKHVAAVYAFARMADDVADALPPEATPQEATSQEATSQEATSQEATPQEATPQEATSGEATWSDQRRLEELDLFDAIVDGAGGGDNPVFIAVQDTIVVKKLDRECFHRLIEAFRRDVNFTAKKSWSEVLEYCSYSANPVGEIILQLSGDATQESVSYSNDICTALQITNFLQDLSIDLHNGREYLPLPIPEVITRTRKLFERGARVTTYVRSVRLKLELKAIIAGGRAMLDLCERTDIATTRPKLSLRQAPKMMRYLFG